MSIGTGEPSGEFDNKDGAKHYKEAPINENHDEYEKNINVAHEMAKAEKPHRKIAKDAEAIGYGEEFVAHRISAGMEAAEKAGGEERQKIRLQERLVNEAIDLLQKDKDGDGDSNARLILYVFDRGGRHGDAYREYISGQDIEDSNVSTTYNYKSVDMPFDKREELAYLLGIGQLVADDESNPSDGEKRYFARSNGYLREVCVNTDVEDNPKNPEAIIFDRFRAE